MVNLGAQGATGIGRATARQTRERFLAGELDIRSSVAIKNREVTLSAFAVLQTDVPTWLGQPTPRLSGRLSFWSIGSRWSVSSRVSDWCRSWRSHRWSRALHDHAAVHGGAAIGTTTDDNAAARIAYAAAAIAAAGNNWSTAAASRSRFAAARCWFAAARCWSGFAAGWSWSGFAAHRCRLAASVNRSAAVSSLLITQLGKQSTAATTIGRARTQLRKQTATTSWSGVATTLAAKTSLNISTSGKKHGQASDARN